MSDTAIQREIVELHQFFTQWFRGELANSDAAFDRFENVTAHNFCIMTPSGKLVDRAELVSRLRDGHGSHRDTPGGFAIDIRNVEVRLDNEKTVLATYEEWQRIGKEAERGRLSTALFTREEHAPNGLVWQHVHETWLAEK